MQQFEIDSKNLIDYINSSEYEESNDIEDTGLERARNYLILLYEDSQSYNFDEVLRNLKACGDYAYIRHKAEKDEKKPHYHFFLHLENAKSIDTLANKTGIPHRFFKVPRSIRAVNRYLIHYDDKDKIQYNISDVVVSKNWERKFKKCFDDLETEEEIIINIYNFIDNMCAESTLNYSMALKNIMLWSYHECYDSIYRKYRIEFDNYLKSML